MSTINIQEINDLHDFLYNYSPVGTVSSCEQLNKLLEPDMQARLHELITDQHRKKIADQAENAIEIWQLIEQNFLENIHLDRMSFLDTVSSLQSTEILSDSLKRILPNCYGVIFNIEWVNAFSWELPILFPNEIERFQDIGKMMAGIFYLERYNKAGQTISDALKAERISTLMKIIHFTNNSDNNKNNPLDNKMKHMITQYNQLKSEVCIYQDQINNLASNDEQIASIYKGCQILYSPLIEQTEILFIGINPGGGYEERNGHPVNKLDPQVMLEYLDPKESYQLLRETCKVFESAGKMNLLHSAVKTNHCYFATKSADDLKMLIHKLNLAGLNPNQKFDEWTFRLIDMIKPKIIICEGVNAFEKICRVLSINSSNAVWGEDACTLLVKDNYKLVGYYRRLSNISNKDALSDLLSKTLP